MLSYTPVIIYILIENKSKYSPDGKLLGVDTIGGGGRGEFVIGGYVLFKLTDPWFCENPGPNGGG